MREIFNACNPQKTKNVSCTALPLAVPNSYFILKHLLATRWLLFDLVYFPDATIDYITMLYKEPQVTQVIRSNRLRWLGHIWRSPENNQTRAYTFKNPMGSRTRGRPPTRWIDDVENDLKTLNILKTGRELLRIVGIGGNELWRQPKPVTGCYAYKEEEVIKVSDRGWLVTS
ncbi:uncharacterized protein TNCV_2695331 [Trichonephila clavipes]|nr:uncharacterized protein TNCV_2695331 [Trichonephila clavipes]